jgi:hypothetical protein
MKKNLISISQIFFIQTMFPLNSYHLFLLWRIFTQEPH